MMFMAFKPITVHATKGQEPAWHSCCVMDCRATAQSLIPDGYGVKNEIHVLCKGQLMRVPSLNDLAVDGTLNTTNQSIDI